MRLTCTKVAALTIVAAVLAGCEDAPRAAPAPSPTRSAFNPDCTTSAAKGRCGPYDTYAQINGTTASTYVGNNVWNPVDQMRQTLYAANPGRWRATANIPAGNTAVVSYPSVGANYGRITNEPSPLTDYSSIYSSFSEVMHQTEKTSAWAAYDIWLGQNDCSPGVSTCTSHEVMIQHDFAHNGTCAVQDTASFGGSGGVPVQPWHLCRYGSELIWKLGASEQEKTSEGTGKVDILSMLTWLVEHEYLPVSTGLWLIAYGWEICSTGGVNENLDVNAFSITVTRSQ